MSTTGALDEEQLQALYASFAKEDHDLAEESMEDYGKSLITEDFSE